jgi:hypothetical protein
MQFSPLAHAALDPRWDSHLLKFNHRGDTSSAAVLTNDTWDAALYAAARERLERELRAVANHTRRLA